LLQAFNTIAPVFGLIVIGYLLSRLGAFGKAVSEGLSGFVFTLGIPALLFSTMISVEFPGTSPWPLWGAYFGAVGCVWVLGWAIARFGFRRDPKVSALAGVGSAYANTMLMGLPMIFAVMGEQGAVPLFIILSVHLPFMTLFATMQLEWAERDTPGVSSALVMGVLKGLVRNPIMLGLAAGLAWRLAGLGLPAVPAKVLEMLSEASVPCALLAMGCALNHYGIRGAGALAAVMTAIKLVVHPAMVWLLATYVFALPPSWTMVAVMFAAAPTGINTFIFAVRYNAAIGMVSGAIALGTMISIATYSLALWGLGR